MRRLSRFVVSLVVVGLLGTTAMAQPAALDAPKPLKQRETIKIGMAGKLELYAALLLADAMGELDKENISAEYFIQRPSDGFVLLATGRIDVLGSQPGAPFLNAIAGGSEMKMIAPSGLQTPDNKQGYWLSKIWLNGRKYTPALLKGEKLVSPAGRGGTLDYWAQIELEKAGLSIKDVGGRTMSLPDILPALENGAISVGFLFDGIWQKADTNKVEFGFGGAPDISGGLFYGPTLLKDRREVGEAVMRAMVRTTKAYLQGDYHHDPKVAPVLAKVMDVTVAQLEVAGAMRFPLDMPIPTYAAEKLQTIYAMSPDVLTYKDPLPDSRVFDRSFAEKAGVSPSK